MSIFEKITEAMNRHDLEGVIACVTPDYASEQPAHPSRSYVGSEQLRQNFGRILSSVPDFRADIVKSGVIGEDYWMEVRWHGTRADGAPLDLRGVMILSQRDGLISRNVHYLEAVEASGDAGTGPKTWTGAQKSGG